MLKVYNETKETEKPIYFKLINQSYGYDNRVLLTIVDEKGEPRFSGNILSISSKGILMCGNVHECFGLSLDEDGRVVIC